MKKIYFWVFAFCLAGISPLVAAEDPLAGTQPSLKDQGFVVETSPEDEGESLERISGDIDLGFTLPDQTYESEGHYRPGPFGRAAAVEKDQSY